jgi:hypothetical protein
LKQPDRIGNRIIAAARQSRNLLHLAVPSGWQTEKIPAVVSRFFFNVRISLTLDGPTQRDNYQRSLFRYGKTSNHIEKAIALAELAQQRNNAGFSRFALG